MNILDFIMRVLIIPSIIFMFIVRFVPVMIKDVKGEYMKVFKLKNKKPVHKASKDIYVNNTYVPERAV